jgi:hypothetical protein
MRIAFYATIALAAGAANLHAQTTTEPRRLVFGTVGHARTADDEGLLGSGAALGVGAGLRVTDRLTVQVVFDRIPYYREVDYLVFDGRVLFVGAEAAFHWRHPARVRPFVTIGAGLMHDRKQWTHRMQIGPGQYGVDTITEHEYTLAAMRSSGGVDIVLTEALSLRAGLTFHGALGSSDDLAAHLILQPMTGIVWRW